jgi:hypothetical protein
MAIPAQARVAAETANRRIAELAGTPGTPAPTENESTSPAPAPENEPAPAQEVADSAPAPAPAPAPASDSDWQQRYNTLQGMFNASQRQSQADIQALRNQVDSLTALLAQTKSDTQQPASADPDAAITDQHRQEYGDAIEMMQRAARNVLQPVLARLAKVESEISAINEGVVPTVRSVAQAQAMTAEDLFFRDLTQEIPNWRDINNNPDFQAWLLQPEPLIGVLRQTILEDAQRNNDVGRVALLFRAWPGYQASPAPAPAPNQTMSGAPAALQSQIAPGRGRAPAAPQQAAPKIYTSREIAQFFDDVRAGRYSGRESEKARMEADIFAAGREGRVQG